MGRRIKDLNSEIEVAQAKLATATDSETRDKILSLLKTVLSLSVLALGILGMI